MTTDLVTFTDEERTAHATDEQIVDRNIVSFIEVGQALARIFERRTYLLTHDSFKAYVQARWGMTHPNASEHIAAARIVEVLDERVPDRPKPRNLRVATAMARLARTSDDPDKVVEVWTTALQRYGDAPLFREVRGVMDELAPPRAYHRVEAPRDDDDENEDAAAFADMLATAESALHDLNDAAEAACAAAPQGMATQWLVEIEALRVHMRSVYATVAHRAKADENRARKQRMRN